MVAPKRAICIFRCLLANLALQEFFQAIKFRFTRTTKHQHIRNLHSSAQLFAVTSEASHFHAYLCAVCDKVPELSFEEHLGIVYQIIWLFIPVLFDNYSSLFGGLVPSFASKFPVFWRFVSQVLVICFAFSSDCTFPLICHVRHVFLAHTHFLYRCHFVQYVVHKCIPQVSMIIDIVKQYYWPTCHGAEDKSGL